MAFLRNDAVNRVNLHSGIQGLALAAGGIFVLAFLLRAGVSVPVVLLAMAGIMVGRFMLRPVVLPLAVRWGLKPTLIVGTVVLAAQYPILAEVQGVGWMLLALVVVAAVGDVFYWLAYNAYFAAVGDAEHRGHQIGVREALVGATAIVGPLAGSWALVTAGGRATFAAVAVLQLLSALPLVGAPNIRVKTSAPGVFRAARRAGLIALADGVFDSSFMTFWQVALFVSLGQNIAAYGGAMALAGLAGAGGGLLLGRHVDLGHGRRSVAIGFGAAAVVVVLRAVSLDWPVLAVIANALGSFAMPLLIPGLATAGYNMSKASPCTLRFAMVTEAGWDIGFFVGCVTAAGLVAAGVSFDIVTLVALPAIAGGGAILWRYYGALPGTATRPRARRSPSPRPTCATDWRWSSTGGRRPASCRRSRRSPDGRCRDRRAVRASPDRE